MKAGLLAILAALLVSSSYASLPQKESELISAKEKFTKDGVIEKKVLGNKPYTTETGKLNGVDYRIYYTDGSGSFVGKEGNSLDISRENIRSYEDNWSVSCSKDPIEDFKLCNAKLYDLYITVFDNGIEFVSVGTNHYPGSAVAIRFDKEPALRGTSNGFSGLAAKRVIAKLKTAKQITTRYQKWPYRSDIDRSWELYGFNEVYQYLKWAVARIK